VLLEDIAGQIRSGQAVLAQKLARWPLDYERLIGQISLSLATRNVTQQAIPGPNRLIFNTGIVALSWGYLFGTWAGRLWGAGELAGAVLSILAVVVAVGFWYLFVGRRRLKRAERDYLAAVATLQSAQVETTWLEAAQTVLAAAEAWRKDEAKKLSAARKSLKNVQNALAARPLQLDSTPVTIETLPYLDGYREWLRGVLQEDPLMLQTQAVLETKQILANWPDLEEKVMLKMFIKAGRLALMEVPEMPIERVLIAQDQEELHSHLKRLHQLATPLINLDPVPYPDQTGGPSTFDLVCLEHGAIRRFQRRLGNHWFGSASVVGTDDPRRLTYIRLVPGFDPGNLSEDWFR
jgi:hypothetical protein